MSSILSAQNLQTFRRRKSVRFLSSFFSLPRPPRPSDERPLPSLIRVPFSGSGFRVQVPRTRRPGTELKLQRFVSVDAEAIIIIVLALRAFTGLPLGRQAAGHAPTLRVFLTQRARALDNAVLFVHADREMANHLIADAQAAIDFLHQLARAGDHLEDVRPFFVRTDLVGKLPLAPVLGLVERARKPAGDFLDLRVQVRDLLVCRVGCHDVDELVLSNLTLTHCCLLLDSLSRGHALRDKKLVRRYAWSSSTCAALNLFIAARMFSFANNSAASAALFTAASIWAFSSTENLPST